MKGLLIPACLKKVWEMVQNADRYGKLYGLTVP